MNFGLTICFLIYLLTDGSSGQNSGEHFEVEYEWSFINYTWESPEAYQNAIDTQRYIPQNNAISGFKFYKDKFYFALPRICPGTPVTLGYIDTSEDTSKSNRLLTPFPDWTSNDLTNHTCDKLENVQSMEIDTNGIMWVLDGFRVKPGAKCPPKLILYDLNNDNNIIQTYTFPEEICLTQNGFLNDIVIDETDGGFAYITDSSNIDPGLIVYSRSENRAWKFRDPSMYAQLAASDFIVDNVTFTPYVPINGIVLSPKTDSGPRFVYYCALVGVNLYSISTDVLKNEALVAGGTWRFNVTLVGRKQAQSDGMVGDNANNLYYGLLPLYGVGRWNTQEDFSTSEIIDTNRQNMIWTDSFSFDDKGYLYLIADQIHHIFVSETCEFPPPDAIKMRVLKYFTGTSSYLY